MKHQPADSNKTGLLQAEQEKKRAEEQAKEQAKKQEAERAAAAVAAAAQRSKPLVSPQGELVHLQNGKSELDDILSRAGISHLPGCSHPNPYSTIFCAGEHNEGQAAAPLKWQICC